VNNMLILIRGPQGAGKTTLATILATSYGCKIYEADQYFVNPSTGEYSWNAAEIGKAHEWCRARVLAALEAGMTAIVSNTCTSKKELDEYLALAETAGVKVWEIIAWGKFPNVHGVPEDKVQKKREAFYLNR